MTRAMIMTLGVAAVIAETALWHGPLGAGDRFAALVEARARAELVHDEMPWITARLERAPLSRTMVLSGRADDFQQSELVRIIGDLPGVGAVRWATPPIAGKAS